MAKGEKQTTKRKTDGKTDKSSKKTKTSDETLNVKEEREFPDSCFESTLSDEALKDWRIEINASKSPLSECVATFYFDSDKDKGNKKKKKKIWIGSAPMKVATGVTGGIGTLGQSNSHDKRNFYMVLKMEVSEESKDNEEAIIANQKYFETRMGKTTFRIGELIWEAKGFQDEKKEDLINQFESAYVEEDVDYTEKQLAAQKKKAYEKAKAVFIKDMKHSSFVNTAKSGEEDNSSFNVNRNAWIKTTAKPKTDDTDGKPDTSDANVSNNGSNNGTSTLPPLSLEDDLTLEQKESIYNHLKKDGYIHFLPKIREDSTGNVIHPIDAHEQIVTYNSMVVVGFRPYVYSKKEKGGYGLRWDFYDIGIQTLGKREEDKPKQSRYSSFAKPLDFGGSRSASYATDAEHGFGGFVTDAQDKKSLASGTDITGFDSNKD